MSHASMSGGGSMDQMMMGALGPYGTTREASGTSWQPDSSTHAGVHVRRKILDSRVMRS